MAASRILVLNAGSSSVKASLVAPPHRTLARAEIAWGPDSTRVADRADRVRALIDDLRRGAGDLETDAVAHRVVHGGARFTRATVIDAGVMAGIHEVLELAPLHNGVAIEAIEAVGRILPGIPQVACFDTAFHATLPEAAWRYPLPRSWEERWGVRRFGFHGLSVAWATRRAAELIGRPADSLGVVVAHLGSGCSVTAVQGGRSVDTSMGWTPLEGLMMGTRAGSVDPGILVRLLDAGHLTIAELADALDHRSGLLAVAGTADMRAIVAAAGSGDRDAGLALAMFSRRAAGAIAAAATALDRLDAIVFTGGIGERSGPVRAAVAARLGQLGVGTVEDPPDEADRVLTAAGARVSVARVTAREDLVMAGEAAELLT